MKRHLFTLFGLVLVALAMGACSKKSGSNNNHGYGNYNMAPNSCYNSGGPNRYQWLNGQCRDVQQNTTVAQNYCTQAASGYSYDPRCNYYGGNQVYSGSNACSIYGYGFYPVYLPSAGGYVCINNNTYNHINSYYYGYMNPYMYNGGYYGCVPGMTSSFNCNCKTLGGTLGWFSAGLSIGICF